MSKFLLILGSLIATLTFNVSESSSINSNVTDDTLRVLAPKPEHSSETFVIVNLLNRYHYSKVKLNDSLSSVAYDNYFASLDPNKSYFLKSDLASFEKYRYSIDNNLPEGELGMAYQVFSLYRERSLERIQYVYDLLETEMDFTEKDYLETDRDDLPWPESSEELDQVWNKIIKNQALSYKLSGKEWDEISESLRKRYQRVEHALYQYNSEDVYQAYMNAFTSAYDPHTDYFSPIDKENFQIDMSLSLEGIGARLSQQLDYTRVADIIPGGPAYKSKGLQKDDKIIGVAQGEDGEFVDVIGWRLDDVVNKIRGPKGSIVRLQVLKHDRDNGLPDTLRLVRDKIKLEESSAKSEIIPLNEGNQTFHLGVITVPSFYINFDEMNQGIKDYKSTTRDVKNLISDLQKKGIDGLMIDLRYNGGGSLQEAIELTGLFIPQGPVVQVKNTDNSIEVMDDKDGGEVFYDGPLAVLINRYSASASEIFSGAIQDYKRGIVVGENSFGKGTVQNLIDIGRYMKQDDIELGQLKMTLAKFYRVTGSSTQRVGVAPDISFPSPYEGEAFGESARPNALAWDEILTADFKPTERISSEMILKLQRLYSDHLNSDKDLKELVEDINEAKVLKDETVVSLNLEERRSLQQEEKNAEDDLSTTLDTGEVFEKNEIFKKLAEDPYLKEGLRLLAALSRNKIG